MKIIPVRSIENDIYSVDIHVDEMGDSTTVAADEIAMLADTPQKLKYSDITFSQKFLVVDGLPVVSDDPSAIEVKIDNLTNKEYLVNKDLHIVLNIDANKIPQSELDDTVFTDPHLLAQAKVICFENCVLARIKQLLDVARAYKNDFEITSEVIL